MKKSSRHVDDFVEEGLQFFSSMDIMDCRHCDRSLKQNFLFAESSRKWKP